MEACLAPEANRRLRGVVIFHLFVNQSTFIVGDTGKQQAAAAEAKGESRGGRGGDSRGEE